MSTNFTISCMIIGYNTCSALQNLLKSINEQEYFSRDIEIIYVDDGSNDNSYQLFIDCPLKYSKQGVKLKKNRGRVAARSAGIKHARGKWVLFINSSVSLHKNFFAEYVAVIRNPSALAFVGSIIYQSKDVIFEAYLNNPQRGTNRFKHLDIVPYPSVLLSNCIIKTKILKTIAMDTKFISYGGAELDFAYKLHLQYPNMVKLCKPAVVYRNNHPIYAEHCNRLYEYGLHSFCYLDKNLKKSVIKFSFPLVAFPGMSRFFLFIYKLTALLYNKGNKKMNYLIIKLGMWCSILAGYHKSK